MTALTLPETRAEREQMARELRAQGLLFREIAERMGAAISTVDGWLNDPGGRRLLARKQSYGGVCVDCGAPTNGNGGPGNGAKRCAQCHLEQPHTLAAARQKQREILLTHPALFSDDGILAVLREADRLGIRSVAAWRRESPQHDWPSSATILMRFGSWNAARERAGLETSARRRGGYSRTSAAACARAVAEAWRAMGCPPSASSYRGFRSIEHPELPSDPLIRIRCGSWVRALEMAQTLVTA